MSPKNLQNSCCFSNEKLLQQSAAIGFTSNRVYQSDGYPQSTAVVPRGFHGLRKAGASYVNAAGGDATKFLDHSNPKITAQHYIDETIGGAGVDALGFLPPLDLG